MQRKSGSPAEMFPQLALGHCGAFRCALSPFLRSSRREPGWALQINVAKTAKASLDMTAAAVDAAPRVTERPTWPVWALAGSLVIHAALFAVFSERAQSPSVTPALPVIMAELIDPVRFLSPAREALARSAPAAVPSPVHVPVHKPVARRSGARSTPLETTARPESAPRSALLVPQQMPSTPDGSRVGEGGKPSGGAGDFAGANISGQVTGGTARKPGAGDGALTPARFDAAYLNNPPPPYPSRSRRLGEEGKVILRVRVSPEGAAEEIEIKTSSGSARLDDAALNTVHRWQFIPARRGNDAIESWVLVPVLFKLEA